MLRFLVNPGQRRLLAFFLSILLLAALVSFVSSEFLTRQFLAVQIEEKTALLGHLSDAGLLVQPQQENFDHVAVSNLLGGIHTQDQLASGRSWLASYGYEQPDTWRYYAAYNPLRSALWRVSILPSFIGLILLFACSFIIVSVLYRQIRRIADLAQQSAAEPKKMAAALAVADEGDLAVLWHATTHLAEKAAARMQSLQMDKKYLQNFLSDISHQIKTPLASIQLYLDLLRRDNAMPALKRAQFIDQGLVQVRRIDWLIQGLLKMARLDAGSVQMKIEPADLVHTVERALEPFAERIRSSRVNVDNRLPAKLIWPHDPEWLAEAFSNLIKNALEHIPEEGTIVITAMQTPLSLQLQVADNGPGIPAGEINRIFERFYRQETTKRSESVGIGLSLARAIFEQNGADLNASSLPGQGAVFTASFLKKTQV